MEWLNDDNDNDDADDNNNYNDNYNDNDNEGDVTSRHVDKALRDAMDISSTSGTVRDELERERVVQ